MKKVYMISLLIGIPLSLSAIFIPILAQELGASYWDIGLIVALFGFANMVSSFLFGRLSDLLGNRKFFVAIGLLASAVAFFMQVFMTGILSLMLIRFMAGFMVGIFSFPMIAYVSRLRHYKETIGRYSGVSSFGWFLGHLLAAIILSYHYIFILSGVLFLMAFLISRELPDNWELAVVVPRFPIKLLKKNMHIYLSLFLRHTGLHALWPILPVYMLALGADKFWVAIILAINPLFQLFSMSWAGRFSERHGETAIIKAGLLFSLVAVSLFLLISNFFYIAIIMLLVSVAWGFLWVGSLIYLTENNAEKSTSTGILGSFASFAAVIGPLLGGLITQLWGFQALFLFALACTFLGLLSSLWIRK
jgi:DHA1 family multidrug resistance protein-like MFS transporter